MTSFNVSGRSMPRVSISHQGKVIPLVQIDGEWRSAIDAAPLDPDLARQLGQVLAVHDRVVRQDLINQIENKR